MAVPAEPTIRELSCRQGVATYNGRCKGGCRRKGKFCNATKERSRSDGLTLDPRASDYYE